MSMPETRGSSDFKGGASGDSAKKPRLEHGEGDTAALSSSVLYPEPVAGLPSQAPLAFGLAGVGVGTPSSAGITTALVHTPAHSSSILSSSSSWAGTSSSSLDQQIQITQVALRAVEVELQQTNAKICNLEDRLNAIDKAIEATQDSDELVELKGNRAYLRDEKKQLRDKEGKLLDKERQLRERESKLLDQEQLRGPGLKLFNFEESMDSGSDFPLSDGGRIIFERKALVKRMVATFCDNKKYRSFYFRHRPGTGKTVLLKLFGRELKEQRGYVVYMTTAPKLSRLSAEYIEDLVAASDKSGTKVALLIDEVHSDPNSEHWDFLLKKSHPHLLVIGAGISPVSNSPQFDVKYPEWLLNRPAIGPLTEEDMDEVIGHFVPAGDTEELRALKIKALHDLRVATGGHLYPFVAIAQHLMLPENNKHLSKVALYLSSEEFLSGEVYTDVYARALTLNLDVEHCLSRLFLNESLNENALNLIFKEGYGRDLNISPLVIQLLLQSSALSKRSPGRSIDIDPDFLLHPIQEQVIVAGLIAFKADEFQEVHFPDLISNERALAFRWGVNAIAALGTQVWIASEVVTEERPGEPGAKPTIDFFINSAHNMGIEMARNVTAQKLREKLQKVTEGGCYGRHKTYILHFDFSGDYNEVIAKIENLPRQDLLYTYVRHYNLLLRGTDIVRTNVVRGLGAPPHESSS